MNCNQFLELSPDTNIFIYGASVQRGYFAKKKLESCNLSVKGFIDRQADKMSPLDEVPIRTLEQTLDSGLDLENSLVIITIANRFSHEEIADMLYQQGFRYIIYQPSQTLSLEEKILAELYHDFSEVGEAILSCVHTKVPSFQQLHQDKKTYSFLEETADSVTTWVPIELLRIHTTEFYIKSGLQHMPHLEKYLDRYFIYFHVYMFLYEAYQDLNIEKKKDFSSKLKIYRDCMDDTMPVPNSDERFFEILQDRYDVYQNMEHKLHVDPLFFQKNPCEVCWNDHGSFVHEDGANRNCFLMSKGMYMVPSRMKKEDFNKWLNLSVYEQVEAYMQKYALVSFVYPIAHPCFLEKFSKEEAFSHQKIRAICSYLFEHQMDPINLDVFDVGSKTGFFGQCFYRMGSTVTSLEWDKVLAGFQELLSSLLYLPHIQIHSETLSEFDTSDTYHLSLVQRDIFLNGDLQFLDILDNLTSQMMILDINTQTNLAEEIIAKSNFSHYETLKTIPLGGVLLDICIFFKSVDGI